MANTTSSIRQKSSTFFGNEGCESLKKRFVANSSVFDLILAPPYCKITKSLLGQCYLP